MNNLGIALEITALGMGLVFAALILLWGMMNLLTAFTAEKQSLGADTADASGSPTSDLATLATEEAIRAQAVAVAVAMAIAEQQASLLNAPPTANVSAWQLGMRSRQMYQKGGSMRRRAR